jgi:hypothetical protein
MAQGNLDLNIVVKNQQALGKVNSQLSQLQASSVKLSTLLKGAAGALAAIGATKLIGSIVSTTARFEDLGDALTSVTGSAQAGAQAFDFVSQFATKTQFGVEDLTQTFIKLKASGIEPTEDLLTLFTDTAAITTDQIGSLQAITDLFARTTSGGLGLEELNRLADRGVPVFRILEEQLGITRLQISEVGKTAEGSQKILNALSKGIREDFGGATARVTDNLSTQFSNLSIALKNSANEFGQGLSPVLKDVTADLTAFIENNEETIAALGRLGGVILKGVVELFIGLAEALGAIVIGGEKLIGFFKEAQKETDHIHDDFSQLNSDFDSTGAGFEALFRESKPVIKALGDMQMSVEDLGDTVAEAAEKQANYNNAMGDFEEGVGKTVAEVLREQAALQQAVNRETAMMNREIRTYSKQVKDAAAVVVGYTSHLQQMLNEYTKISITTDTLIGMTNAFATTAETALTDVVLGTKTLQQALGEIGQAILRELVGGIIRLLVVGPLLRKLAEIFGVDMVNATMNQVNAQKKLNSELKKEIGLRAVLALFTGGGGFGIPFFANGGNISGGQPAIVGERGPELFIPNTSGEIISNSDLTRSSQSSITGDDSEGVTINFNISTVDARGFDELLTQRQELIISLINRGLTERGRARLV